MEKIIANYHGHTIRCGHAKGTEEEYVLAAIENGYQEIAFTDHCFYPTIHHPGMRGDYSELDDYVSTIRALKEKYKDKISIKIGFEAEYSKFIEPYLRDLLNSGKIDFLIMGEHCSIEEDGEHYFLNPFNPSLLVSYTDHVIEGIKSGLFKYVCHPDFIFMTFSSRTKTAKECIKRIVDCAKEYDIPLEVNLHGYINTKGRAPNHKYPNNEMFEEVGRQGVRCIFGIDCHDPSEYNHPYLKNAFEFVKKHNLNMIDRLEF